MKAAFTPEGEPLVCGTWSGTNGDRQDVIIHCVEGGDYPVLDGDFHEHKRTGGLLPPLSKLGVAAASGVMLYRAESFPPDFRGNLFSALFNMHKIVRHVVERDGATFRSRDHDFLVSDQADFHPTDVLEDADGSILVIDTGSWFGHRPTSRLGKGPVSGGIYRVRREGAAPPADPRGLALDWRRLDLRELARNFDDPRVAVRDRAVAEAARRGTGAIAMLEDLLREAGSVRARLNAVWALARIEGAQARAAIRRGLDDRIMSGSPGRRDRGRAPSRSSSIAAVEGVWSNRMPRRCAARPPRCWAVCEPAMRSHPSWLRSEPAATVSSTMP